MNRVRMVEPGQQPVDPRRSTRAMERRRRTRSRRSWVAVLLGIALLAGALGGAYVAIRPLVASFTAPDDYTGQGTEAVTVTIPEGASGTVIAQTLRKQDVVKSAKAFIDVAGNDTRAAAIQPGVYQMRKQMSAASALEILVDPANRMVKRFTVREGERLSEIVAKLPGETGIKAADVAAAIKTPAALGLPPQAKGRLEGWLFPATYEISPQTDATDLLSQMVARTVEELNTLGVPPAKWNETLTAASLIEAERGSDPADAPKIARVFLNRFAQHRPLQLDTTVNYVLGQRKVDVKIKQTDVVSPYNTYQHQGLPPGAICSPGAVAIKAWLHPAQGPWLYFVAVDPSSGLTKYATTEREFFALQAELNAWLKAHPGQ